MLSNNADGYHLLIQHLNNIQDWWWKMLYIFIYLSFTCNFCRSTLQQALLLKCMRGQTSTLLSHWRLVSMVGFRASHLMFRNHNSTVLNSKKILHKILSFTLQICIRATENDKRLRYEYLTCIFSQSAISVAGICRHANGFLFAETPEGIPCNWLAKMALDPCTFITIVATIFIIYSLIL